ncbi:hypothetical protein [Amaricoccus sp.]|uniref:hypothetical protein n=1 Tax=Amaricoccus sp. TaxID=1872485 RepID=UPI001B64E58C|nr:hypothetical protein [Amaricoccus sp.]MBP7002323.1 hypothetical protein [Amaricoccus sp.]
MEDTILIFTCKGMPSFLEEGGSGHWKVRPERINRLHYAVFCRNRHTAEPVEGNESHGDGFLVARIAGVVPSPRITGRSIIQLAEVAPIEIPELWQGFRNPTLYTSMDSLGIDVGALDWRPMAEQGRLPDAQSERARLTRPEVDADRPRRTFGEAIKAKRAELASEIGVAEEAIEITIRGL